MFAEERLERIQNNCFRRKRELNWRVKTRLAWNRNKEKGTLDTVVDVIKRNKEKGTLDTRCYKEE